MRSAEIGSDKRVKVTFFSNFLNHHQLPFCIAMDRLTEGQFTFVATTPVPQERLKMGYIIKRQLQLKTPLVIYQMSPRQFNFIVMQRRLLHLLILLKVAMLAIATTVLPYNIIM